jgi:hypothetical protein
MISAKLCITMGYRTTPYKDNVSHAAVRADQEVDCRVSEALARYGLRNGF